jgi:hypothetical protein
MLTFQTTIKNRHTVVKAEHLFDHNNGPGAQRNPGSAGAKSSAPSQKTDRDIAAFLMPS